MSSSFFSSIRVRILLLIMLTMVPALGYILYIANEEKKLATHHAQESAMRLVQLASKEQESYIFETRNILTAIANHPQIRNGDYNSCKQILNELLELYPQQYAAISIAQTNGNIIYSTASTNNSINVADLSFFKKAINARDFTIGEYQVGRTTGKPSLKFAYPVLNDFGDVQAVIIAALDLIWLSEQLSRETLHPGANLTIRDRNGTILARYPDAEKWVGKNIDAPLLHTMQNRNGEGITESIVGIDGITRFYAYKQLYNTSGDIYLSVGIPEEIAFANVNRILKRNFLGIGTIILLTLLTAWVGINIFVLCRVNSLLSTTRELAGGKMNARTNIPHDAGELGQLAYAFDKMAEALEHREAKLRRAETKYRTLVEQIPAVTYIYKPENGFKLYVSPQIKSILGFTEAEWADVEFRLKQIHPDDRQRVQAQVSLGLKELKPFHAEYRVFTRDGQEKWVFNEAVVIQDETNNSCLMQGVMYDITQLKRSEEALEAALTELNQILQTAADGLCVIDKEFNILKVNKSYAQLAGVSIEDTAGRKCYDLFPGPVCHTAECTLTRILKGEEFIEYDIDKKRRDGTIISCILTATPYRDASGKLIGVVENIKDITERKQMEMEMVRYEQLNLIGEMAAGIGHEIRNPMTTVRGFLQVLGSKKECAEFKNYFDLMIEELDRANAIITEFLSLAKSEPRELKPQNLNSIIETMQPLIQSDATNTDKYIKLELDAIPDIPLDDKSIRQLILNLVRNGLEAMSAGGELTIKTFIDNGDVVLAVQDQGSGISSEVLPKLGTPFFTTKDNGTGLGLPVCYKIAANHKAAIDIKSNQSGSTFFVRFRM